ncbi:hornerin-like [Hibiscus syriacus]|uniref:hornerin-like n=1 Tax=Hibiscus syriacus TaxID=106335 RepID=UPI00192054A2|nr:hornerin-like [Hibiscus syriacus]
MGLNGDGNNMGMGRYANRGSRKEAKYQGTQINGYAMAETWDEYGQLTGHCMSQSSQLHGPGKNQGRVYGYGKNGSGMGHGFGNHGNYQIIEAYGYEETNGTVEYVNHGMANGYREYANNGMARSHPHLRGKHSGHGNGFVSTQSYGGGRGYHSDNGLSAKGSIWNNWGENSCNDSDSDNDDEVWTSKAL